MASTTLLLLFLLTTAVSATISPLPSAATPQASTISQFLLQQQYGREPQQMPILAPILSNLGFQELAMTIPSLATPFLTAWSGPVTIFAPSDDSIRSCLSCSPALLLREHLVPGLFPHIYLSKLAFGTKLETTSPGRCLTITTNLVSSKFSNDTVLKIFVDGIEVTRPDMFNDGRIVIHGLQGYVTPLSPESCNQEVLSGPVVSQLPDGSGSTLVRLMLRDAIVRLRDGGYSILALAMRVKYAELVSLQNMTIFALDDGQIFAGGHSYVTSMKYHVVPNKFLMHADLLKLPSGASLPTLVHGKYLVITHSSNGDPMGKGFRINYVPIKKADVVYNIKIAIHTIFLPFPQLQPSNLALSVGALAEDGIFQSPTTLKGTCPDPSLGLGACYSAPSPWPAISPVDFGDDGL